MFSSYITTYTRIIIPGFIEENEVKCVHSVGKYLHKKYVTWILLGAILTLTFGLYAHSLDNGFTNWDDPAYVTENPSIRKFSADHLTHLFLTTLKTAELSATIFSFAIDYKLWTRNPRPYHLENLILHLLNVLLVFFLMRTFTTGDNIALLTALFFAIHPFRVESVAWVSQRKDVLYACFYLSGLLSYLQYIRKQKKYRYLVFAVFLFICSLLSKDAAVTFVFLLLLIDYYLERRVTSRTILEKIPFVVVLMLRLWNHYLMPHSVEPIIMGDVIGNVVSDLSFGFHVLDRIFLACYAVSWYIIGLFAPIHLAIIHPLPVKTGHFLPFVYYLAPLLIMCVLLTLFFLLRTIPSRKEILFGILFFLIQISIALHIVPIGGVSIVAERYTYLASIGLFFIVSHGIVRVLDRHIRDASKMKPYVLTILALYVVYFSVMTYTRNSVWKNSVTLWSDQIDKHPEPPDCMIAYIGRGNAKGNVSNYPGAIEDFTKAIECHPNATAYYNRGRIKDIFIRDYHGALHDFTEAIALNPNYAKAYNNRGVVKGLLGNYQDALEDFNTAIELNPNDAQTYTNRGNAYAKMGNTHQAVINFQQAIVMNPTRPDAYYNRAIFYIQHKQCQHALSDIRQLQVLGAQLPEQLVMFFHRNCKHIDLTH